MTTQKELTSDYWSNLMPHLSVLKKTASKTSTSTSTPTSTTIDHTRRLLNEGYFTTQLNLPPTLPAKLAQGITQLRNAGWPASFILMYDEAWELSNSASQIMSNLTTNTNNGDMLAWDIDPNRDEAGFSPHRDRQPIDITSSFHTNADTGLPSMPKYSTAWIALTNATPENSCLYVVPKEYDPGYMTGDVDAMDPLQRCLPNKNGYQNIMALPVNAGSGVFFSHRILHWGSRGRKGYAIPRMALSIACSTEDFEPSYFANPTEQLPYPDLEVRLGLICGQCICYHERFSFNGKQMKLFTKLWRELKCHFSSFYQKKVLKEMVQAIEEALQRDERGGGVNGGSNSAGKDEVDGNKSEENEDSDEDDDMLDAALDAMLEGGDDMDFRDDYDDVGEGFEVEKDAGKGDEVEVEDPQPFAPSTKKQKLKR